MGISSGLVPPSRSQSFRPRITPMAIACFLTGATQTIKVSILGEAVLAELLLPLVGMVALMRPEGRRILALKAFWWLLGAMLITLGAYILSDVIRETPEARYLRGWGRITLVATSFLSLCAIAALRKQNLWWFAAGMALGRVLFLRLMLGAPVSMWKFSYEGFGYGEPLTIGVCVALCFATPRLISLAFVALALLSIYYDFRSHGALCMILAGLLWARAARPEQPLRAGGGRWRLGVLMLAVLASLWAGVKLSESDYASGRRGTSDIGRAAGKVFAMKAIAESPLIGYGSWSRSRELHHMYDEALKEVAGKEAGRFPPADGSSATHSMALQAWVEGGVFAIAFFVVLGVMLLRTVLWTMMYRSLDELTPTLLYFGLYGLWHIVMSPFAAPLRIHLALAAVGVVFAAWERRRVQASPFALSGTWAKPAAG